MAFDWREYLNLAKCLAGQEGIVPNQEASFRSAVSRAYYAAFCHARNRARDLDGFSPKGTGDDHQRVRKHFKCQGKESIASTLDDLRQWRNHCDYDDKSDDATLSKKAIAGADEIINELSHL